MYVTIYLSKIEMLTKNIMQINSKSVFRCTYLCLVLTYFESLLRVSVEINWLLVCVVEQSAWCTVPFSRRAPRTRRSNWATPPAWRARCFRTTSPTWPGTGCTRTRARWPRRSRVTLTMTKTWCRYIDDSTRNHIILQSSHAHHNFFSDAWLNFGLNILSLLLLPVFSLTNCMTCVHVFYNLFSIERNLCWFLSLCSLKQCIFASSGVKSIVKDW